MAPELEAFFEYRAETGAEPKPPVTFMTGAGKAPAG
jgi:hypothetical protein